MRKKLSLNSKAFLYLPLIAFVSFAAACSHSIKIKGARFVSPVVADKQWGGFASVSGSADTRITLVDDIDNNPPTRGPARINQDADAGDLLGLNFVGFEAGLSVYKSVELYLDNATLGARWQLLNHAGGANPWVATVQVGYASGSQGSSYETESNSSKATSDIKRQQGGLSVGRKMSGHVLPYASYLYESYDVETSVTNSGGSFGPYEDKGHHQYLALGLMSHKTGFLWAVEYNHILIDWARATTNETQNVIGFRLGGTW